MTKSNPLPIEALILERSAAHKLRRSDLVRRAGFKNVAKGLRRLDELCAGELKSTASLIAGLPPALESPPEVVADVIRQTEQQIAEAERIAEQERDAARNLTRELEAEDRAEAASDWFAQMRRKEQAEYLARTQAQEPKQD